MYEGRFILSYKSQGDWISKVDVTGQDVLYYFSDGNNWAYSNSFLKLVEYLSEKGVVLTSNNAALASFNIQHSFGDSLTSDNTVVNEVKVLPISDRIRIKSGNFIIERIKFEENCGLVSDSINVFFNKWMRRIIGILGDSNLYTRCDVSGGIDSRAVLGLILKSGGVGSKMSFISNKSWVDDFRIANLLSSIYGFSLNDGRLFSSKRLASNYEKFLLYCYSSIGVYKPVYFPKYNRHEYQNVHFSGSGGENLRLFYNASPIKFIDRFKKYFDDGKHFEDFKHQFLLSCESLDIDINDERGMMSHYRNFRSRFHFGRNWYKSYTSQVVSPLFSTLLNSASDSMALSELSSGDILLRVMLMAFPELSQLPYDKHDKGFSEEAFARCFLDSNRSRQYVGPDDSPSIFQGDSSILDESEVELSSKELKVYLKEILNVVNLKLLESFGLLECRNKLISQIDDVQVSKLYRESFLIVTLYFLDKNNVRFN